MSIDAELVAARAAEIRGLIDRFATGPVKIVAVSKRFGADAVEAALSAGLDNIGESYAQELLAKASVLAERSVEAPEWHFVGNLQRNKVSKIAHLVGLWHSVDSLALGTEIAKRAPGARVLVQVNASGASTQGGTTLTQAPELVAQLRNKALDVRGLMTIGIAGDIDGTAELFSQVRRLADRLELPECSMGMSADLGDALRAGSTMVRVGTAIFGPRPNPG